MTVGDFNGEYTEGAEEYREDRRDVPGVNEPERLGVEVREGLGRRKWRVSSDELESFVGAGLARGGLFSSV